MLNGLSQVNIELSSICDKNCGLCGRRKYDREHGIQDYGYMPLDLVKTIAEQIPENITIATHWNGESLTHPQYGEAVSYLKKRNCFVYSVSNGKLLMKKKDELINNLDCISISIIQDDTEEEKQFQYEQIKNFIKYKKDKMPVVILRFVGIIKDEEKYIKLGLPIVRRVLHIPDGSRQYTSDPTIPEHGVCQDLLNRIAIDRHGDVSCCVRFDPNRELVLGNIMYSSLNDLWNSEKRLSMIKKHIEGNRSEVPYCGNQCEFFGVATSR